MCSTSVAEAVRGPSTSPSRNVDTYALDDAAMQALWGLLSRNTEYLGALYADGDGVKATDTISSGDNARVSGTLAVPRGSLRALYHNHPDEPAQQHSIRKKPRNDLAAEFSRKDKQQADALGVLSYITTPTGRLRRYDPASGKAADVLAQLPLDQMIPKKRGPIDMTRAELIGKLLGTAPNDPRGLTQ